MKKKAVVESILSVGLAVAIITLSTTFGSSAENITPEMLTNLVETAVELIRTIFPPAIWLGNAMAAGIFGTLVLCIHNYFLKFSLSMIAR